MPLVMGVLNVTPDSFSDGGRWLEPEAAVAQGLALAAEGADIVDVGGESTRPGAEPVDEAEELRRVVPVIEALAPHVRVSVDTGKTRVAEAAIGAGATLINDVTAGLYDVAAAGGVAWAAYHLRHLRALVDSGYPVLVGASRKSFLGKLTGGASVDDRVDASMAVAAWAFSQGAGMVRAHDVAATVQAARLIEVAA